MPRLTDTAGALASSEPSLVLALVDALDDPEGLGRMRVRYVTMPGSPRSGWLRPVRPEAGPNCGLVASPARGDEVLVARLPSGEAYVLGALHNGVDRPPTALADGGPGPKATAATGTPKRATPTAGAYDPECTHRRAWRSRSGHLVILDDSPGAEGLRLFDASGHLSLSFDTTTGVVILASATGDVSIRAGRDLFLDAGRDVVVTAGRATRSEAPDWSAEAHRGLALRGRSVDVSASADLALTATGAVRVRSVLSATMEAGLSVRVSGGVGAVFEAAGLVHVRGGQVIVS